ncbi:DivIVA domain-containing protein [Actinomadura coerulea]|uniref:Cell wall synthesis protein Wag31 n=1 Tax=Actinomadura coerulea TaxID=46159 RepID=A0A7X0L280_9ACTN|nr:DivIVA domain-containing protein [Actinomadura coerulea]MBB6399451.1 DivIVA domain-containing protein [Actinomadura coerulea]GGQ45507.1 hypothetical protein GCM10010187_74790 [Actinomadura coerulea]
MSESIPGQPAPSTSRLAQLDANLSPEVKAWAEELRRLWKATDMSMNRFLSESPLNLNKGTLSRYLSGKRVPGDTWLMNKLLDTMAAQGKEVPPEVRDNLTNLHLQALEKAHPHAYKVRQVSDQLQLAELQQRNAEQYAHKLEEQLADLTRQYRELTDQLSRLRLEWNAERAALQAEKNHLEQEISDLKHRLENTHQYISATEQRRRQLERTLDTLDSLDTVPDSTSEFPQITAKAIRDKEFGTVRLRTGYNPNQVDQFLEMIEREVDRLNADRARLAEENVRLRQFLFDDGRAQA